MSIVNERINGFDALRAAAMWLGVVLHALIVYKETPEANWPHDQSAYLFLDWLYDFIHIFRMPLFYLVSGFFAHLVIAKYGMLFFLKQRFKRIVIPFVISLIVIVPLSLLPFHFNRFYFQEHYLFQEAVILSFRQMLSWNGMAHLWFLYYLIVFYVLFCPLYRFLFHTKPSIENIFKKYRIGIPFLLLSLYFLFFALLYFSHYITPPVYTGIKPAINYILYYGFFFSSGWILYYYYHEFSMISRLGVFSLIIGIVLSVFRFVAGEKLSYLSSVLLASLETFFMVYGIIGVFIRFFNKGSRFWRYLSDSSYWVYLIHVFIVATVQVLLLNVQIPGFLKLLIALVTTVVIAMITYRYFVRYTIIGETLNGKRQKN
ncbi:MAG: acyltransferase family protein [Lacibacter sp.]|jgi:glucan biosynthesis protein C